jgi:hypothetical protein
LLAVPAAGTNADQGQPPQLSAAVSPAEITLGATATVTGTWPLAGQGIAGASLQMQAQPYPYRPLSTVTSSTEAGPGGSFSFAPLRPDRNTRIRVLAAAPGQAGGAVVTLQLYVDPRASLTARSLGPGRTLLSLRIRHAILPGASDGSVRWFVAAKGSRAFHLVAATPAAELRPGLLNATAVVDPPARRFAFRACVNPSWARAMGPPAADRPCPTSGFVLPAGHAG